MAESLIDLSNVSRSYSLGARTLTVLSGISLKIEQGDFVAIMGPSGSGKTTLLNIVGCLDRPSNGSYRYKGEELSGASVQARARLRNRAFGFVFQSFNLLPRTTALENIELPLLYRGTRTSERLRLSLAALDRVGLADRADHMPDQLSGGEQQRVAIARALVATPSVILADEPTGALDSVTGKRVMALVQDLNAEGLTAIVVTHNAEIAGYARRLVRLRDGRITSKDASAGPAKRSAGRRRPERPDAE